jgi:hypothetical protein
MTLLHLLHWNASILFLAPQWTQILKPLLGSTHSPQWMHFLESTLISFRQKGQVRIPQSSNVLTRSRSLNFGTHSFSMLRCLNSTARIAVITAPIHAMGAKKPNMANPMVSAIKT